MSVKNLSYECTNLDNYFMECGSVVCAINSKKWLVGCGRKWQQYCKAPSSIFICVRSSAIF